MYTVNQKQKPISVVVATGTMNAGGAETLIMEQLRHRSGNDSYIMLIHYSGEIVEGVYDQEIRSLNIPIYYIHSVGSVGEKKYTEEFCQFVDNRGPFDIVHCHLNAIGGVISKAAKKSGIPKRIVHCHADITFKGSFKSRIINELKLQYMRLYIDRYATDFWACSLDAAKRLFYKKRLEESVVIPNIIDAQKYLSGDNNSEECKKKFGLEGKSVIGSVGRIARIKNYELIIEMLKGLKDRAVDAQFACFGRIVDEAYYDELVQKAERLGVLEQLHFLGNSTQVSEDIHCFDVFVMPSYSEGFGIAAIEAQAAGLPSVVSTGVPKIVDVNAGLISFVPPNDIDMWIETVLDKLNQKAQVTPKTIIECFNKSGFNSPTAALAIEQKYTEISSEA